MHVSPYDLSDYEYVRCQSAFAQRAAQLRAVQPDQYDLLLWAVARGWSYYWPVSWVGCQ